MKGVKHCTNWLVDNQNNELLGQRSGNKVVFNGNGFFITYADNEQTELTLFSVFDSEEWAPVTKQYATWGQARYWMESRESINKATFGDDEYVIQKGQLRKVDIMDNTSYTVNFWTELTNTEWIINY